MTFEDVLKRYALKVGEEWGNMTEDLLTESLERVASAYWDICLQTGCTFKVPILVSLGAVTADTNKYQLTTLLGCDTGYEILAVYSVTWKGLPVSRWDKIKIDTENEYFSGVGSDNLEAFGVWEEFDDTTHDKITYIGFYPFMEVADAENCRISAFLRPPKPTTSDYTSLYPVFGGEYHELIAELAAQKYLGEKGDVKLTNKRILDLDAAVSRMKGHFFDQVSAFEVMEQPIETTRPPYFYHR